ncbi:uncharacterized protein AMSG_09660 [Thecamonas trahens ATCC 50062]|uniref:Uncharacterized protein n=1 Tax=Thecamonas trahens ATCC 50062 TaxID=461836 RepID=A0A0L0DNW7_THETB|nr:hypothetical protein AMSG_09660 [Thecamonas trahens ATCC 50062]KNC54007.1 hypothetical protein AMSG_09660 [Thecamonas trahens ATCC 50062]|eukprot:XP_013754022.1 hypothetical protein AMSG_09660 [Thecamonas trahens ATCC 50062]
MGWSGYGRAGRASRNGGSDRRKPGQNEIDNANDVLVQPVEVPVVGTLDARWQAKMLVADAISRAVPAGERSTVVLLALDDQSRYVMTECIIKPAGSAVNGDDSRLAPVSSRPTCRSELNVSELGAAADELRAEARSANVPPSASAAYMAFMGRARMGVVARLQDSDRSWIRAAALEADARMSARQARAARDVARGLERGDQARARKCASR